MRKCNRAPGRVTVLGVGSVIKVHNHMAVMAIRPGRLILRTMHRPVGNVSDVEEGCRWSGECRWLKRREPLRQEGASYANISKVPNSFHCSGSRSHLYYRLGEAPEFESRPSPRSFMKLKVNFRVRESRTRHLYGNYFKEPAIRMTVAILGVICGQPWSVAGLSPRNTEAELRQRSGNHFQYFITHCDIE